MKIQSIDAEHTVHVLLHARTTFYILCTENATFYHILTVAILLQVNPTLAFIF